MKTYQFRFNNSSKTVSILIWFFTALLTITLTVSVLLMPSESYYLSWVLVIIIPLMVISIYRLYQLASKRQSIEIITLSKNGFTSSCFGSVLFSDINSVKIPAKEISLLGGEKYDYYKRTELNTPHLIISIKTNDGKMLRWVLGEWGGLYNSKEDFLVFFEFLTVLTDQLYLLYHDNEPTHRYLKILDENGFWKKF